MRVAADRLPGLFAQQVGHALGRSARSNAARAKHDYRAFGPWLADQSGGDRRGLARARRRDQHGAGHAGQRGEKVIKNGVDRQLSHAARHSHERQSGEPQSFPPNPRSYPHGQRRWAIYMVNPSVTFFSSLGEIRVFVRSALLQRRANRSRDA